jgi:hypothetical protein
VALGLGCTLMGSNSCLVSFLAPLARLACCSKQPTAWLHRYTKKWRSILACLSGALAGSPGRFFLLSSATIEPPRATASASPRHGCDGEDLRHPNRPPVPPLAVGEDLRRPSWPPAPPLAGPSPNPAVPASSAAATTASHAAPGWPLPQIRQCRLPLPPLRRSPALTSPRRPALAPSSSFVTQGAGRRRGGPAPHRLRGDVPGHHRDTLALGVVLLPAMGERVVFDEMSTREMLVVKLS